MGLEGLNHNLNVYGINSITRIQSAASMHEVPGLIKTQNGQTIGLAVGISLGMIVIMAVVLWTTCSSSHKVFPLPSTAPAQDPDIEASATGRGAAVAVPHSPVEEYQVQQSKAPDTSVIVPTQNGGPQTPGALRTVLVISMW